MTAGGRDQQQKRSRGADQERQRKRSATAAGWLLRSAGIRPDFVRYYLRKRSARRGTGRKRRPRSGGTAGPMRAEASKRSAAEAVETSAARSACNLATDRPEASEGLQGSPGSKCLIFKRTRTPAAQLDFSDFSEKIRGVVRFCVFFYPFSPTFKKKERENIP